MYDQLKIQLGNALVVDPREIMDVKLQKDGAYTVILYDFKKFTDVQPQEDSGLPTELRRAYGRPTHAKKSQLAELAELLGLEIDPKATKKEMVAEIKEYRIALEEEE